MIAIIDYGVGNLFSLKASLDFLGENNIVTADSEIIKKADRIILLSLYVTMFCPHRLRCLRQYQKTKYHLSRLHLMVADIVAEGKERCLLC